MRISGRLSAAGLIRWRGEFLCWAVCAAMGDLMNTNVEAPFFTLPIQEAVFWRGAFLHHYSIIEFLVSDVVLRSLYRDEYRHLGQLPETWQAKLDCLGAVLDAPGPLTTFSTTCRSLLKQITLVENDRHLFTHGKMSMCIVSGVPIARFESLDARNSQMIEIDLPVADLRYLAQELGAAAYAFGLLVDEMIKFAVLEPIPLKAAKDRQRKGRSF